MLLDPSANLIEFLDQVAKCDGTVLLQTPQGDSLNLRSELCRFIFMCASTNKNLLRDADIQCSCSADYQLLEKYLLCSR